MSLPPFVRADADFTAARTTSSMSATSAATSSIFTAEASLSFIFLPAPDELRGRRTTAERGCLRPARPGVKAWNTLGLRSFCADFAHSGALHPRPLRGTTDESGSQQRKRRARSKKRYGTHYGRLPGRLP